MSMKAGADLLVTLLSGLSPAPSKVVKVPPGHGDDVPRMAGGDYWVNLEPLIPGYSDEPNKSGLRKYRFTTHYWYSSVLHDISDTADVVMDMTDALLDKLQHENLGGWARHGIDVESYEGDYAGGDDNDTLYVVRLTFTVERQET